VDHAQSGLPWKRVYGSLFKLGLRLVSVAFEARWHGGGTSTSLALDEPPNMIIVDTTVWIDYLKGRANPETDYLDRELSRQRLGLADLILCETLQGISDEGLFSRALHALRAFEIFETGGEEMAIMAARNFRTLRMRGSTVRKTIDA
jgi:predicted nucleic acid-binding protein